MATKDVTYLNKDFDAFMQSYEDFIKAYYPNSYTDFTASSVGNIFMNLSAMTGDGLAFYQDYQFNETLYPKELKNALAQAYVHGYKPKMATPSSTKLTISHQVPAKLVNGIYKPDLEYSLFIKPETIVSSLTQGQNFYIKDSVDFSHSSQYDMRRESVFITSGSNNIPTYFLLEKDVTAISGTVNVKEFVVNSPTKYLTLDLIDDNIIEILSIEDSEGNKYYEVDNMSQSVIFDEIPNTIDNNSYYGVDYETTPLLLQLRKVSRRFVTRFKSQDTLEIEFGAGTSDVVDEVLTLNPDNIGLNTFDNIKSLDKSYDISNFISTSNYGISPKNTTLIVKYLVGGGLNSNVDANIIDNISLIDIVQNPYLDETINLYVLNSVAVNNYSPATGGKDAETIDEIRRNSISEYLTQNRIVSESDYITRVMAMPSKYGSIDKIYVRNGKSGVELFTLGYDRNKHLGTISNSAKYNLKTYLSKFNSYNKVSILDAFVINFKFYYDIVVLPSYNSNEVLLKCNEKLINYFNIDNWQLNQPIILSDIFTLLSQVNGVQNISNIRLVNISGGAYSEYSYDLESAKSNNIIYPSKDIMIFECKFPNTDIFGRVINY